jgi:hypothetical protein
MEQVRSLVPVDPHAAKVVAEKVVQGVSGKKAQAVRDPVRLLCVVEEVRLDSLAQITNGLSPLLVSARPDAQCNAVEGVRRILLQHKRVMHAVGLASSRANLNIVRKAGL